MTITKLSAANYTYINRATYYFSDDTIPVTKEIQKTGIKAEPIDGGFLLQYSYFDFLKFDDTTVTGELFSDNDLFLLKLAIPHTCSYVNLSYSTTDTELTEGMGIVRLTLSETREKTYDTIASVYASTSVESDLEKLEVTIHETNYANPHEDQVIESLYRAPAGGIIVDSLVKGLTNRYRLVPFGNFILTEDGCKYWMGNFTTNTNGVE